MTAPRGKAGGAPGASPPPDLAAFLRDEGVDAEFAAPGTEMPTVATAATALGVAPNRVFKSILFQARDGTCVLAVACGDARVDARRLESLTGLAGLRLATPAVALAVTGYPAGGTPPVGHRERIPVVVDARVIAQGWGWAGGGRREWMLRIAAADIVRLTGARVATIAADPGARGGADSA